MVLREGIDAFSSGLDAITSALARLTGVGSKTNSNTSSSTIFKNGYLYAKKKPVTIRSKSLAMAFAVSTLNVFDRKELTNKPYADPFHDLNYYLAGSKEASDAAMFLNPEEREAFSSRFNHLRDWILAQPDNSIEPHTLFVESLKLTNGDMFGSAILAHDLLRKEARFFDNRYIVYKSTLEERAAFFNKFIDLRGDLDDRGKGNRGDHAGTWYRMFGILTKVLSATTTTSDNAFDLNLFDRYQHRLTVAGAELLKPLIMWRDPDTRKIEINLKAVSVADYFIRFLNKYGSSEALPEIPSQNSYLARGRKSFCGLLLQARL
ncbi:MAG: hypothetical protein HYW49_03665 [Deltaproteobacteria bacterium]|nr:hypothetical protein [Deltaproteobacteria bacterium]